MITRKFVKSIYSLSLIATTTLSVNATAPDGYYSSCEGKCGAALLSALCDKIASHTNVGYDGLWRVYETSDVRDDGTVWDMYSTKHWEVGKQLCGNYSVVGDCINREHSFPKSWFNDAAPMYSDAYHLYPTDGKVNGQRSNFPYGECAGGTTLPSNGSVRALGKLGASTFPGYSGKVFEPDDEYKGDFARSYFYMAACYNTKIAKWNSDMLAGNSYPAFTSWAVNLLMKWHRQDPVSQKELTRNDEVAKYQKNRNPFIDYPDLAEHIWGDKKNLPWSSSASAQPSFTTPVDGSTLDLGVTSVGHSCSRVVNVQGGALTADVTVTVSGSGFSVSASTLPAASVCAAGANLTITYTAAKAGEATATVTLRSGTASTSFTVKAKGMDGIPVGAPTHVSDNSFIANWVNIDGPSAKYTLTVWRDGAAIPGYPVQVNAAAQEHEVTGLEPLTTYTYQLSSGSILSEIVTVTTGEPIPMIQFLYDGVLSFTAEVGVPSDVAEILLDVENIDADITISVTEPFEVSTDKSSWGTSNKLAPDEDRFYMRVLSQTEGEFATTLTAKAGDYSNDVRVSATVGNIVTLYENFEGSTSGLGSYSGGIFSGEQMDWKLTNAGIYAGNSEPYHSENQSVRFGKASATSAVEMVTDKNRGVGTCSFWAQKWRNDAASTLAVEYSTDGGSTWHQAGTAEVAKDGEWEQHVVPVKAAGDVRIRISRGTSGGRLNLDDIELTDYSGVGTVNELLEYHAWDAYCRSGRLVVEGTSAGSMIIVYGVDGVCRFEGVIAGQRELFLPDGLYLVSCEGFTRRVLVK